MEIQFRQAGRKFPGQTVFQQVDLNIESGSRWSILGGNGSGKSTFLKTAFGALSLSEGQIQHYSKGQALDLQSAALRIAYAAPYLELIEELAVKEFLQRYAAFRPFRADARTDYILERTLLSEASQRKIRFLSSGMKQRLRLGIALLSEAELVILDEPTSNLDRDGVQWYQDFLQEEIGTRTLLIGTNYNNEEAFLCDRQLRVSDYR